ncbi:MAG: hypothetical protein R3C69_00390 [Geminicoccaceae bacterium]
MPPLGFLPAVLVIGLLFVQLQGTRRYWPAFARAWLFGFGFHLAGLYWVMGIAFLAEADRFGALAVPGVVALAAVLAVIGALPLALMGPLRLRRPIAAATVFAGLWCLGELARGQYGVQFPWNPLALALAATDASLQVVALVGTTAASFLVAWLAALAGVALTAPAARRAAVALLVAGAAGVGAFGAWRLAGHPPGLSAEPPVAIRVVQANIAQHHKWDPALRRSWFERHLDLSRLQLSRRRRSVRTSSSGRRLGALFAERRAGGPPALVGEGVRPEASSFSAPTISTARSSRRSCTTASTPSAARASCSPATTRWTSCRSASSCPCARFSARSGSRRSPSSSMDFQAGPGRTTLALP